jgi:hypothetical protein
MIMTGENSSSRKKPVPVPLGPPQISHGLIWDRKNGGAGEVNTKGVVLWREESITLKVPTLRPLSFWEYGNV